MRAIAVDPALALFFLKRLSHRIENLVERVDRLTVSSVQTGATAANPIATVHVHVALAFDTLFPYPFLPHGGWTLTAEATYAVVRGR